MDAISLNQNNTSNKKVERKKADCICGTKIVRNHFQNGNEFDTSLENKNVEAVLLNEKKKTYECDFCDKRFAVKGKMNFHIASVHEEKVKVKSNIWLTGIIARNHSSVPF